MFKPCEIEDSVGRKVTAECGVFTVAEDPAEPEGARLELFVVRGRALGSEPASDAVTIVNGGPGGSSVSLFADLQGAFAALGRTRDLVVMDQRGTGRSAALECPVLEAASQELDVDAIRQATRSCLDALARDPRFYTTSVAVTDLEDLRRALGYSQWNLYGVSYGTRVVQHYLQRYPNAVRTAIIDGVLPPGLPLGPDVATNAQRALDALLARCRAETYCTEAFPELDRQLETLAERLRQQPITVELPDPVTGRARAVTVHYAQLALTLRLLSYAPETAALIPLIIQEAAERENYLPLTAQALVIEESLTEAISFGMHNSVVCTEDVPWYGDLSERWPALDATYLGGAQVRALAAICEIWPRGVLDPRLREPTRAPHPVLLLSGELDPITPPEYAEQARASYPNSLHLIAPGQGHGVVGRGCLPQVIDDFVTAGSLEGLDSDCVSRMRGDAFFVNLLGPPP